MPFKPISAAIAVFITLLIWFVIPVPEGVTPDAWHLLALFVGTIAAIIGKALPIGAVSIIAITMVALTGVTADTPKQAMNDALSSFSNSLIWLIAIAVITSRGLVKTGLGARIAYNVIAFFGKKPWVLATRLPSLKHYLPLLLPLIQHVVEQLSIPSLAQLLKVLTPKVMMIAPKRLVNTYH